MFSGRAVTPALWSGSLFSGRAAQSCSAAEPLTPAFSAAEPLNIYERASMFFFERAHIKREIFQSDTMSHRLLIIRRLGQSYFSLRNVRSLKIAAICLFIFFMCISPRPLQTQSRCKHQTKNKYNRCLRLARSLKAIPARVGRIQAEN